MERLILSLMILTDISSQPRALLGLTERIIWSNFSSEIAKVFIKVEVTGICSGIALPVSIVVH